MPIAIFGMLLPLILIGILFVIFWIIMLVDAVTRKFNSDGEKIAWILVIIFVSTIGALIYYFVVYMKHKSMKWFWITLLVLVFIQVIFVVLAFVLNTPVTVQKVG